MRSRTECCIAIGCAVGCWFASVPLLSAQVGEVMESDDDGGAEANNDRRAERISARDWGDRARSNEGADEGDADADGEDGEGAAEGAAPMQYRVGADNGIEVGGHVLISYFTVPARPALNTGLGFSGRIATTVYEDIVAEANVGIMFNKDSVDDPYTAASLRVGARLPIDLGTNPLLFFFGAGAALEFLSATNSAVGMTLTKIEKSAITPAFDLQLGAIYDVTERLGVEVLVHGTYAFANVVWEGKDASWVALSGGVSYDL